jgi:FixJ family two-component response regulator
VEAKKYGADCFLGKPVNIEELKVVLEKLWERQKLVVQKRSLQEELKSGLSPQTMTENRTIINHGESN